MRSAKKEPETEFTMELTPEQEALLEEGLDALERGDYIEIEFDDDDDAPTMVTKLRHALHGERA